MSVVYVPAPSAGRTMSVMLPRAREPMGAADFTPYMPDTYTQIHYRDRVTYIFVL